MNDKNKTLTSSKLREIAIEDKMSSFVMFGDSSCGKSSTLDHLIVLLNGGGQLCKHIQSAYEKVFLNNTSKPCYKDSRQIIHYKRKVDGKEAVIYVSTMGDTWQLVEQNFKFFYRISGGRLSVHMFDGTAFVEQPPLNKWIPPCPLFCISPANFHHGAIQAERYFLDMTCLDWKRERWILKEKLKNPGDPVPGYTANIIKTSHEQIAGKIIEEIDRMMDETLI